MQTYQKNYINYHDLQGANYIPCEVCGSCYSGLDIHHIVPRSKFGSKRIVERDSFDNLIGLCRLCHIKAHNGTFSKEFLLSKKKR